MEICSTTKNNNDQNNIVAFSEFFQDSFLLLGLFLPWGKVTKNRLVEICIVYVESLAEKHQDYIKTLPVNMGIMAWHGQTSPEQAEFMQIIIDFYIE